MSSLLARMKKIQLKMDALECSQDFSHYKSMGIFPDAQGQLTPQSLGRNSVANLRKTMIYNTNIDLVNDNVYTKFGLNRSIRFQDFEQKLNSDVNQGP